MAQSETNDGQTEHCALDRKADFVERGEEYMQETFLNLPDLLEWIEALGADSDC